LSTEKLQQEPIKQSAGSSKGKGKGKERGQGKGREQKANGATSGKLQ
jgi:hypothetical protein